MPIQSGLRWLAILVGVPVISACSTPIDSPPLVSVVVDPAEVELRPAEVQRFTATVAGAESGVSWTTSGGTFTTDGSSIDWTAPAAVGDYTVTATVTDEPSISASAQVRVVAAAGSVAGYRGTAATLPPGFFVTGENAGGWSIQEGYNPFTGVSRIGTDPSGSFDGFGAFTSDGISHSFGIRERGKVDLRDARLFYRYVNSSDRAITAFEVEYDVEVWRLGERGNQIRLKVHVDTVGLSKVADLVATPNPRWPAPVDSVGFIVDGKQPENRTEVRATVDLDNVAGHDGLPLGSLAPGDTIFFRWQYSNLDADAGELRSALAIDGVQIQPVFANASTPASEPLRFSHGAGFYRDAFRLELQSSVSDAVIYYTVDGSVPDPEHVMTDADWASIPVEERRRTFRYEGPIDLAPLLGRADEVSGIPTNSGFTPGGYPPPWEPPKERVQKAAVVRAIARTNTGIAAAGTRSFFVSPKGADRYSLPVVSLTTDRENLFGPESGIYVPGVSAEPNYNGRGADWERPAHLELFDDTGRRQLAQNIGVRIHGGGTRALPQKTLRIYARSEYGSGELDYRFFKTKTIDEFDRILLRNGGNDWWAGLIRDPIVQTLVHHLGFETQHYQPAILFINGEYWGIHNFRDRLDAHYLEEHYGIPRDELTIVENDEVTDGSLSGAGNYSELLSNLRSGALASRADFERFIDVDSYLDYLIVQMYIANTDWPQHNVMAWRYAGPLQSERGPRDGRWRWMMFDVDRSLGYHSTKSTDMVRYLLIDEPAWMSPGFEIPRALLGVRELRDEFIQRTAVHLSTTFRENRVKSQITATAAGIETEVQEHIRRWNWPASESVWRTHLGVMEDFAAARPNIFREHVVAAFSEVTGTTHLQITNVTDAAGLNLHGVELTSATPGVEITDARFTAELFAGVPLVLKSEKVDLRYARIAGDFADLIQTATEIRLVPTGNVTVDLP